MMAYSTRSKSGLVLSQRLCLDSIHSVVKKPVVEPVRLFIMYIAFVVHMYIWCTVLEQQYS